MSYSRDDVKAITDKILDMAKAEAVEVEFSGGERSATRYANSTITANLTEHDQEVTISVRYGQKSASTTIHQFDDASLKRCSTMFSAPREYSITASPRLSPA